MKSPCSPLLFLHIGPQIPLRSFHCILEEGLKTKKKTQRQNSKKAEPFENEYVNVSWISRAWEKERLRLKMKPMSLSSMDK